MVAYFLDTSALVKRYVLEPHSLGVIKLFDAGEPIYIARITVVETVAALSRRAKSQPKERDNTLIAISAFETEYFNEFFTVLEVSEQIFITATHLAKKCTLRGYDSIQLAACVLANQERALVGKEALEMVCFDKELKEAAIKEGQKVKEYL